MKLFDYIPTYYKKSKFVKALFEAYENMLDGLRRKRDETRRNALVVTASERLELHEKDVGLLISADSDEVRRARVISRLRGWNTVTCEEIVRLAEAYGFENVSVDEHFGEYMFTINTNAQSSSIFDDMREAVSEVKPAHLGVGYHVENTPGRCDMFCGMTVSAQYKSTTIYPDAAPQQQDIKSNINYGQQLTVNVSYVIEANADDMKGM